jgi:hypothetical protein
MQAAEHHDDLLTAAPITPTNVLQLVRLATRNAPKNLTTQGFVGADIAEEMANR